MIRIIVWTISIYLLGLSAVAGKDVELLILGVAQDAGFPQSGCYEPRCVPAWEDKNLQQQPTSLAVIDHAEKHTFLFEATPGISQQLYRLHKFAPSDAYDLSGVFLTHAHIGHYTGLMYFGHEVQGSKDVPVFAMPRMREFLTNNGPWSQLVEFGNISLMPLVNKEATAIGKVEVTPFLVPHRDEYSETVGYQIKGPNRSAIFIPDIDKWDKWDQSLVELVKNNDYLFLDATFYAQGELPNRDMSKVPHPLVTDTMNRLKDLPESEKNKVWFIHFNHTNPLLIEDSEQSNAVLSNGFNISRVGVRLPL